MDIPDLNFLNISLSIFLENRRNHYCIATYFHYLNFISTEIDNLHLTLKKKFIHSLSLWGFFFSFFILYWFFSQNKREEILKYLHNKAITFDSCWRLRYAIHFYARDGSNKWRVHKKLSFIWIFHNFFSLLIFKNSGAN